MPLDIINYKEVTSTNDLSKDLILSNKIIKDTVIIADIQTNGRGRLNNRSWISVNGNFHASFIINLSNLNFLENKVQLLNNISLESIIHTLSKITRSQMFSKKIPNDILINSKKLAGVLIEVIYPYSVIGIGINLTESPIESSTNLKKEFKLLVKSQDLVENLYESLVNKVLSNGI